MPLYFEISRGNGDKKKQFKKLTGIYVERLNIYKDMDRQ